MNARSGKEVFVRRIPGLEAVDEAIGRATEMGRSILYVLGLGGVSNGSDYCEYDNPWASCSTDS